MSLERKCRFNGRKTFADVRELFLTAILAIVGGFLDSYSYLMRGHVFANAQTGNIVLFGVNLQKRDFTQAFYYFVPILAFAVGVILVEIIKHFYKEEHKIHWRQRIVALEFVLITVVGFIPLGQYDVVANVLISFVCSMQVETFRRVHGHPFASTMCTGNLSGTEALCQYFKTGDKTLKQKKFTILWNYYFFHYWSSDRRIFNRSCRRKFYLYL